MNEMQIFNNSEFGELGLIIIDGKEYFPATACAKMLGYKSPQDAILQHCKGSVKHRVLTKGGEQDVKFIPEGDLYRLIVKSKLPSAEKFERWIFDEVIPTIRKHNAYLTDSMIEEVLMNPDTIIKLATQLKEERIKTKALETKIQEQKPMVEFSETVLKSKDNINMETMAKIIGDEGIKIGRNRLFEFLRDESILKADNIPYQTYMERGWFKVTEKIKNTAYGDKLYAVTLVTPKGQVAIVGLVKDKYIA